jgi:methyl-accepting chemotaxis protein
MVFGFAPRMALFVSMILALLIALQTILSSRQQGQTIQALMGARLESVAATATLDIDGDLHEQIQKKGDAVNAAYSTLRSRLFRIAQANGIRPDLVYTLRRNGEAIEFVVMADEKRNDIGNKYIMVPPEVASVLDTGRAAHRGLYRTEHGRWISGFAPIRDHAGRIVALLELDYEISDFFAEVRSRVLTSIIASGIVVLVGVVLVFAAVRARTRRIVRLTELADAISRGEVEKHVPQMGTDEIGRLALALDRLRESVRTSLEMLQNQG